MKSTDVKNKLFLKTYENVKFLKHRYRRLCLKIKLRQKASSKKSKIKINKNLKIKLRLKAYLSRVYIGEDFRKECEIS